MAKDLIFQQIPPKPLPSKSIRSEAIRVAPPLPRRNIIPFKGAKRHKWIINLSQHTKLEAGDTLREGDEWYNCFEDRWEKTVNVGSLVGSDETYRRRLR